MQPVERFRALKEST